MLELLEEEEELDDDLEDELESASERGSVHARTMAGDQDQGQSASASLVLLHLYQHCLRVAAVASALLELLWDLALG